MPPRLKSLATAGCTTMCVTAVLVGLALRLGVAPAAAQSLSGAALQAEALKRTNSLKTVGTPPAPKTYVANRGTLKILGKALFWEQQVGSDGQGCASCHFHAGADSRSKNQLNPGFRNQTIPGGDT